MAPDRRESMDDDSGKIDAERFKDRIEKIAPVPKEELDEALRREKEKKDAEKR